MANILKIKEKIMSDKKSNGNNKKPQIAREGYIPNNKNKRQGNQSQNHLLRNHTKNK